MGIEKNANKRVKVKMHGLVEKIVTTIQAISR
jgi:hypothetical protein